jgi:trichothecene 3-O-acetyltransferase
MSLYQDVIGQLPILKTYNHGTLGFEVADDTHRGSIVEALQAAADKLTASFPWLGGAVINEGSGSGNSGLFMPVPWPASASSPNSIVRVKDCTDSLPSFADMVRAGAPCLMIDGKLVAPYPGFPASYQDSAEHPAPIIAIQANFIEGGLLLNFSAQHNVIDASGMMQVVQLFATAMRGDEFPPSAVEQGNRDRTKVIPLIAPGEPIRDHSHLKRPLNFSAPAPPSPAAMPKWAYFRLEGSAVPKIKALASVPEGHDPSVPFISSNDALSAFYWKCLAGVRARNGRSPDAVSKFGRAIDSRRAMGVSSEYMGHMVYHAATRMSLRELEEAPVSTIACRLRKDLNDVNNEFSVRSYATYIANEPDKSRVMYGGLYNPDTDIGSSALPGADVLHSFGPIGMPQFARRPNLAPIPGCIYFMPPEGRYIPVLVCLRDDDLEGLKTHPEWSKYTEFVG